MAPVLFRSLVRGERDQPLEVDYVHGRGRYVFRAPGLLGCDDLRVLQGLVALANGARRFITAGSSPSALALRGDLHLLGNVKDADVLLVETSLASVARSAGYGAERGGAMGVQLRASLRRLASVTVEAETIEGGGSWRLLSWDEDGAGRNRLRIALNPRLSLCAKAEPHFTQIEMGEARRLSGDLARLLHQRLSGWINAVGARDQVGERRVQVETLMEYAWGRPANEAAKRQRRVSLRSALVELEGIGWKVRELPGRDGLLEIARPSSLGIRDAAS